MTKKMHRSLVFHAQTHTGAATVLPAERQGYQRAREMTLLKFSPPQLGSPGAKQAQPTQCSTNSV